METNRTTGTGTSLELLAPFLPFEIEVEVTYEPSIDVERGKLLGAAYGSSLIRVGHEDTRANQNRTMPLVGLNQVLPVLRPFSQLTTPIYDGFIPAVTATTLLANDWAAQYNFVVHEVKGNRVTVRQFEWDADLGEVPLADYSILADWNFIKENMDGTLAHCENVLAAYDYLRGQHFAVGLEPYQFIEKTPAATPTKQEGNGHE